MMRKFISAILVVVASAALAAQTSGVRYNRAAEKTYSGTIKALVSYPASDGTVGVHLDLKTTKGMITVHVSPLVLVTEEAGVMGVVPRSLLRAAYSLVLFVVVVRPTAALPSTLMSDPWESLMSG